MHRNGLGTPASCDVAVQFLKAVAERGPWGAAFTDAHDALTAGKTELPLHLYAGLAAGGFEVAQHNVAFLLDEHYLSSPDR
jgi:SEL1 protein